MLTPPGLMVLSPGSSHTRAFLTLVLPERVEVGALKGDGRNCVHTGKFKGLTFTRILSTVYSPNGSELQNRWRVTKYTSHEHVIVSAFCYFTYEFGDKEMTPIQRKKKVADKIICSSQLFETMMFLGSRDWSCFLLRGLRIWQKNQMEHSGFWKLLFACGRISYPLPCLICASNNFKEQQGTSPKVTLLRFFRTSTTLYIIGTSAIVSSLGLTT